MTTLPPQQIKSAISFNLYNADKIKKGSCETIIHGECCILHEVKYPKELLTVPSLSYTITSSENINGMVVSSLVKKTAQSFTLKLLNLGKEDEKVTIEWQTSVL